jgi:hypothetical protein
VGDVGRCRGARPESDAGGTTGDQLGKGEDEYHHTKDDDDALEDSSYEESDQRLTTFVGTAIEFLSRPLL